MEYAEGETKWEDIINLLQIRYKSLIVSSPSLELTAKDFFIEQHLMFRNTIFEDHPNILEEEIENPNILEEEMENKQKVAEKEQKEAADKKQKEAAEKEQKEAADKKQKDIVSQISDILKDKAIKRIAVVGNQGYGKTTLAYKLAKDWANKENYISDQYDALFLISLKHLQCSIEEKIDSLFNKKISHFLEINQEKSLLILDGFNDLSKGLKSLLLPIIHRYKYPNLTVIVTTRPNKELMNHETAITENALFKWDKIIFVCGLEEIKLKLFLQNYFQDKFESFQKKFSPDFRKSIFELSRNPLYFFSLANVIKIEEFTEMNSNAELVKRLVDIVIQKYIFNQNDLPISNIPNSKLFSPSYEQLLSKLGKLYLNCKERFIYRREEILREFKVEERIIIFAILNSTILIKSHCVEEQYVPVHVILLQFCTAEFIWELYKINDQPFFSLILYKFKTSFQQYVILQFLSGLSGADAPMLFEFLVKKQNR